jgi:hypothetical protein
LSPRRRPLDRQASSCGPSGLRKSG